MGRDIGLNMRQHREKQLVLKAQREREAQRPSHLFKKSQQQIAVDLASGSDQTVESLVQQNTDGSVSIIEQNIELRLQSYLDQLSNIRAVDKKVEFKKLWLPEFQGFIDASLAQSPAEQNTALMYLMAWAIDTDNFKLALQIGQHGILNGMVMPEKFKRTVAEVLAENVAEACIKDVELGVENASVLESITELVRGEDIVNEAHAKIYKAFGLAISESRPAEALEAFKNALRLHDKSGVKKNIEQLERLLKRNTTESSHDKPSDSQDVTTTSVDATTPVSTAPNVMDTHSTDGSSSDSSPTSSE
ncbi:MULTISPECIES: phage terminase small subunit [unclassified Acinetobacter]|uniref:phage terminase small subunit n=1 Tax=unclassified Acinetobacter TaxID=196816 RepID=UPI0022AC10FA|nr:MULTISPECIES: phage terminase small subunit [unclassified Acinetobacter]WAU72942.1 phage terminase small subunit [Acinetobacter sp. TR11]WAU76037.1 phage terminase small subunit [Acinetobacter sp. TR3]